MPNLGLALEASFSYVVSPGNIMADGEAKKLKRPNLFQWVPKKIHR